MTALILNVESGQVVTLTIFTKTRGSMVNTGTKVTHSLIGLHSVTTQINYNWIIHE